MRDVEQYLNCRDGRWYYLRRVPAEVAELDGRKRIRTALKTSSIDVAKARRDSLAEADDAYWASLLASTPEDGSAHLPSETAAAQKRYRAAKKRAMARGFIYTPSEKLVQSAPTEELVERLAHIGAAGKVREEEAQAVLGKQKPSLIQLAKRSNFITLRSPKVTCSTSLKTRREIGSNPKRARHRISSICMAISQWTRSRATMPEASMNGGAKDCPQMMEPAP